MLKQPWIMKEHHPGRWNVQCRQSINNEASYRHAENIETVESHFLTSRILHSIPLLHTHTHTSTSQSSLPGWGILAGRLWAFLKGFFALHKLHSETTRRGQATKSGEWPSALPAKPGSQHWVTLCPPFALLGCFSVSDLDLRTEEADKWHRWNMPDVMFVVLMCCQMCFLSQKGNSGGDSYRFGLMNE